MDIIEVQQGVIWSLSINRPKQLNALNKEVIRAISETIDKFHDDREGRVMLITGAGQRAFVAGADIKEFVDFSPEEGKALSAEGHEKLFNKIAASSKPIIAAVNGFALGGGLELALACSFRIASENAKFGLPEVKLGLIPGYGGTQRLIEMIGKGKALELMCSADMLDAEQAKAWGLVNHVVPQEQLMGFAENIASRIAENSPNAISALLHLVNRTTHRQDNFDAEIECFGSLFGTPDFKEGTSAFIEKRKAKF